MSDVIRAKLRCLNETCRYDQGRHTEFAPVIPKRICGRVEESGSEENERFWKASPSGKLQVYFQGPTPYTPGEYYYVDMRPSERSEHAGLWKLEQVAMREGQMSVSFRLQWDDKRAMRSADFELTIDNEGVWPAFERKMGSFWDISIISAEG